MQLRQKKTYNLSEDAFYSDFQVPIFLSQNLHFQNHNRKPDFDKSPLKDPCKASIATTLDKSSYAEILVRFITNTNLGMMQCYQAKLSQQIRNKSRPPTRNVLREQNIKPKRFRKTSENLSFDEEKKVENVKSVFSTSTAPNKKVKTEEKGPKTSDTFSINKTLSGFNTSENKRKEPSEQNIINNCFMGASFNMNDYARFVQHPYFMLNQQIMSNWLQINPFMVPNVQQLSSLAQGMKSGLSRQLEIYEKFSPQPNLSSIQKAPFQFTSPPEPTEEKKNKNALIVEPSKKMSPDKIFKRASYHVGIAYSIYMDEIQKQGKKIKNFSEIDPTRFSKKYKIQGQKI